MGLIYADIELINAGDLEDVRKFRLGYEEVRRMHVEMLVDTGAYMLCINENIVKQLDLPIVEKRTGILANGQIMEYDVASQVEVRFKNRRTICNAMVLPGDNEPLLGAIPMEDMPVRLPFMIK